MQLCDESVTSEYFKKEKTFLLEENEDGLKTKVQGESINDEGCIDISACKSGLYYMWTLVGGFMLFISS